MGCPTKGQVFPKIGRRKLVAYYDRAEIEDGAIAGRGLEIARSRIRPISCSHKSKTRRIHFEDGTTLRINYDVYNGYPYTAAGRILIDRGIISKEQTALPRWLYP
jgi:membrane-bound lytic murein transglycosylase A